jgi:hypothetical protein
VRRLEARGLAMLGRRPEVAALHQLREGPRGGAGETGWIRGAGVCPSTGEDRVGKRGGVPAAAAGRHRRGVTRLGSLRIVADA